MGGANRASSGMDEHGMSIKVVIHTITVSPHQLPLAFEIQKIVGAENFRYVSVRKNNQERDKLGWGGGRIPDWVIYPDDPETREWLESADVLISGERDVKLFTRRSQKGLQNYYMSERWFKPPWGILRLLSPKYFFMAWRMAGLVKRGKVIYLPTGVYAAQDMARLVGFSCGKLLCLFRVPRINILERNPLGKLATKPELPKNVLMLLWGYFVDASQSSCRDEMGRQKNGILKILWVGRMLNLKRVDTIVQVVKLLLDEGKHISLTLVGLGPEEEALRRLAGGYLRESALDKNSSANMTVHESFSTDGIAFYPSVPIHEVRAFMRMSDVYVLASNGYEGWGAVVNEAMAEGCCVVGTHEAGSSSTMIEDGVNGLLFHSGDVQALAGHLRSLMDPSHRTRLAEAGQRTVQNVWSAGYAARELVGLAQDMCK